MREVVVSMFLSLDGVMEEPTWTAPYWNDEIAQCKFDELFASDALLLGRITYQGFAEAWPSRTDEAGFADRMNGLPKHVVSATLEEAGWNNSSLIKADFQSAVSDLKQQPGKDILVFGSGMLVDALLNAKLVDRFQLLVYPVILGSGKRLFKDGSQADLSLLEGRPIGSGVMLLIYQPRQE